jgi:hypothetical protein
MNSDVAIDNRHLPWSIAVYFVVISLLRQNVDKLGWLVDIAAESDLIDGVVPGDKLTGDCRFLRRLT